MEEKSYRKRWLVLIIVLVSAVSLVLFLFFGRGLPTTIVYQIDDDYPALDASAKIQGDSIVFFNGRNFIAFNPWSGESVALLGENQLYPELLEVSISPDQRHVLMRAAAVGNDDILALSSGGQADFEYQTDLITNGVLFLLDTATDVHRYVGHDYVNPLWKDDSSGFYHSRLAQPGLWFYGVADGTETVVLTDGDISLLVGQKGGDLLLRRPSDGLGWSLVKLSLASGAEAVLAEDLLLPVSISPDGAYLAGVFRVTDTVDEEFPRGTLRILDTRNSEILFSKKDVGAFNAAWSSDSSLVYLGYDNQRLLLFKVAEQRLYQINADAENAFEDEMAAHYVIPLGDGFLYYAGAGFGKYFSFMPETTINNPLSGLNELRSDPYYGNDYSIAYLASSNKFALTSYFKNYDRAAIYRQAAEYMRSIGVDINFLDVSY